jgi:putative oxidoreductase
MTDQTGISQSGISGRWALWAPRLLSVLRIVTGFLFIQPGTMKIFAYPIGIPPMGGTVELFTQVGIGGVMEVVGGAMLLVGLFTRPVAFILAGEMAVAYWQFHAPGGFWPIVNGGSDAMLFCFLLFYLSAAGGGPWGVDGKWRVKVNP